MKKQTNHNRDYEFLRDAVADHLMESDSPTSTVGETITITQEYKKLQNRLKEIENLKVKITGIIAFIEQAEIEMAKARKLVADEEKKLASFSGELGRSVFAGFKSGEIQNHPILKPRLELQGRIDDLDQKRWAIRANEKINFLDKTKQKAQLLALVSQIKVEEFKISSTDRALGEAILALEEIHLFKCSHTESVLKSIIEQQQRVTAANEKYNKAGKEVTVRRAESGEKLGRSPVENSNLRIELKEVQNEVINNSKRLIYLKEQLVDAAIKSEVAKQNTQLGPKLVELAKLREHFLSNNRLKVVNSFQTSIKFLVPPLYRKKRFAIILFVALLLIVFVGLMGWRLFKENPNSVGPELIKSWEGAGAVFSSEGFPNFTIRKWKDGMISGLPHPNFSFGLNLIRSGITNKGLQEIAGLNYLKKILLSENDISDKGLESLINLGELIEISLNQTKVSDDGLKNLAGLKNLNFLYLEGTKVSDAGIDYLDQIKKLKVLDLSGTKITDNALEKIAKLDELNTLRIAKTSISDVGLNFVAKTKSIQFLDLAETKITDSGLKSLETLPDLSSLSCGHTQITDRGLLKIAAKFKKLEILDLDGTEVTDVGLLFLADMRNLQSVGLMGCLKVSEEGVKALESKNPKLKVYYNSSGSNEEKAQSKKLTTDKKENNTTTPDSTTDQTFRYTFNGKPIVGRIEQGIESKLVFYDRMDTLLSLTINESTSTAATSFFGVTDGRLHLGSGKENISLQLAFFLEGQTNKGPTRRLATSRDEPNYKSPEVRGYLNANYLRPGPSYKTHWFGKPASLVPKDKQMIFFGNGRYPLVGFGIPFKIDAEPEITKVQYADFSPSTQLASLKKYIADPKLEFVIGDRILQIDDSARRTLFLCERAVAVLRYREGARDSESRPSLSD